MLNTFLKTFFKDIGALFQEAWKILNTRDWQNLWFLVLLLPLAAIIPFDSYALAHWRFDDHSQAEKVAQTISKGGDFYTGCFVLVAALIALSIVFKKKNLRLLAFAMLLSCAFAGISSLAIRITSGRPRPSIGIADGLYGPQFAKNKHGFMGFNYDYQSFPSGHATTAFATALPAVVVMPAVGIPLLGGAIAVSWSRFQLNRHHLSDLYMGLLFGGLFGTVFGLAAKRNSRKS